MEPRYTRFLISANAKSPPPLKRRNRRLGAARAACFARHRCETPPPRPGFPLPPELVGLIAEQLPVAGIAALARTCRQAAPAALAALYRAASGPREFCIPHAGVREFDETTSSLCIYTERMLVAGNTAALARMLDRWPAGDPDARTCPPRPPRAGAR